MRDPLRIPLLLMMLFLPLTVTAPPRAWADRDLRIVVAADEEFTRRPDWEDQIRGVVATVSRAMEDDFGLEISVARIERWRSEAPDYDLSALSAELKTTITPEDGEDLVVGFCGRVTSESDRRLRRLGQSDTPGRYIIVTDLAGSDLPLVLRHELAHAFGAPHVKGVASVMAPDIRSDWQSFDPTSAAILRNNLRLDFDSDDPLGGVRLDTLEDLYDDLARDDNDVADLVSTIGDSWRHRDDAYRAGRLYRKALDLDEDLLGAHLGLGQVALKEGRYEEAVEEFETARSLDAGVTRLDMNLGLAYAGLERFADAGRAYQRAIESDPRDVGALNNLGLLRFDRHDYHAAEELFLRALAIRPDYAEGWNNLGMLYGDTERPTEALRALGKALEIRETPMAHRNMASVLIRLGQRAEAVTHLEAAHRLKGTDPR